MKSDGKVNFGVSKPKNVSNDDIARIAINTEKSLIICRTLNKTQ